MQDLRLALRQLLRRPGPSLAAILSLALGIGANAAIYSVLHAVVLRPLPYPEAASLVDLAETSPDAPIRAVAPANFFDWQRELTTVSAIAAYDDVALVLTGPREPERLRGVSVSGAFFPLLGVTAAAGRTLGPADDVPGAGCTAVLSHALAARLSGTAIGSPLTLDGHACVVVGVLPETFTFAPQRDAEIWISGDRGVPRDLAFAGDVTALRDAHYLSVVARLRPGVSVAAAGAEAQAVMARLAAAYPATNTGLGAVATQLHARIVGPVQPVILGLQVAVLLLLFIACANVAHLLLGQAAGRQGEIATRVALGAGRSRLVRQLLAEALALAVPGGVLGLLLAAWGLDALLALAPASVPRLAEVRLDAGVLGFAALLTLGTAAVFGLGPALQLVRGARLAGLQGTRVAGSRGTRRWQRVLMIGELATAQLLLVGAAWLLSSVAAAQDVPLGYVPAGRIAVDLNLAPGRYLRPEPGTEGRVDARPKWQMVDAVLAELDATPGVRAAAAALAAPLGGVPNRGVRVDDAPATPGVGPTADFQLVTPTFFRTLGIPLERGRGFVDADREDAPPVAVVNRAFAERYLPGTDPRGHVVVFGGNRRHEIVGIAADARYRDVERPAAPTVYVPLRQNDERWGTVSLLVSSDGDPSATGAAVRAALRHADPELPLSRLRTVDDILAAQLAPRRFATALVGALTLVALLLAAVGAYGVVAHTVATRTREFGVRSALGASPARLVRALVGESVVLTLAASVLGLSTAAAAGGLLSSLLFGVSARDPLPYVAVAGVALGVVLAASLPPARRVLRIAPTEALRDVG